ncbi:MAG: gamma-glutamyl-gamma-aminobutyrate hydrolase family protein [Prevotellaceae bacterium]|nr:gamma-glutamyl-gamma-aminobutyrate hydrolase family protein [Prevotellaceae bacterium]
MHHAIPALGRQPVIGITGNFGERGCELAEGYYRSVLEAGGVPLVIPPHEDRKAILSTLSRVDGLLLSGGVDLNPLFLGEEPSPALHSITPERDKGELLLIRLAFDFQLPILAVCRGVQMLAAALGGAVHQDIAEGLPEAKLLKHSQDEPRTYASHTVSLCEGSLLRSILGQERVAVNSFHHQAVSQPGPHLRVSAIAPDGVIEAVESSEHKSILGVQWHPECFILRGDTSMMPLFSWLTGEAASFREAVSLHDRILTLDSHCDTPMKFGTSEERLTTLPRMCLGHLDSAVMVAYLPQGERDPETLIATTAKTDRILGQIERLVADNCTLVDIALKPEDLPRLKREGKKAIFLGIENGYAIGKDLSQIEHFRRRGVVYMTLCHNGDNDICDSARGQGEHGGLSPFGREVVRELNRTGMMVDLSHAAETSFWQALELSSTPIVCSHSSCRALCDHPRNLTDEQMQALARRGGVMQVTLYDGFLRGGGNASILDAIEHINHAVSVMGIQHVGIGTDFDGDGGVPGVANAAEVINLTRRLLRERYSEADLRLLWGGNFLRLMSLCQATGSPHNETQS